MRVLMLHNHYQYRGGEDESVDNEVNLLRAHGHPVRLLTRHNQEIAGHGFAKNASLFFAPTWSRRSFTDVTRAVREFGPDIVHVQNLFPLLSPSVLYAASRLRVPVVMSLRNYRLICASSDFYRRGCLCEACLNAAPWRAVTRRCYRDSTVQSLSVALMLLAHRLLRTWDRKVDLFVTLTDFSRRKFVQAGFDVERLAVRPNFLAEDPGVGQGERRGAVCVGRLQHGKGLECLLSAWAQLPDVPLTIVGDGPLRAAIEEAVAQRGLGHVRVVGQRPVVEVFNAMQEAQFLVMPSELYETFGRTLLEAYATGTPVIASGVGTRPELVEDGRSGLLFRAGDARDLADKVRLALSDPAALRQWGGRARALYESRFSAAAAAQRILEIYERARARRRGTGAPSSGSQA